jgi:hypothetical protein
MKNKGEKTGILPANKRRYEEIGGDCAKQRWAFAEHKGPNNVPIVAHLAPYMGYHTRWHTSCPLGGIYSWRRVCEAPRCSLKGHPLPSKGSFVRGKLTWLISFCALAVIVGALLVLLLLPSGGGDHYHGRPATLQINSCINNLRGLDGAKQQWAIEDHKTTNDVPTMADLTPNRKCERSEPD